MMKKISWLMITTCFIGCINSASAEEYEFPIQLDLSMKENDLSSPVNTLSSKYSSAFSGRYQDYKDTRTDGCWEIIENVMKKKGWESIQEYLENTLFHSSFEKIVIVDIVDFKDVKILKQIMYESQSENKWYSLSVMEKTDDAWFISCKYHSDPEYHKIALEWGKKNEINMQPK